MENIERQIEALVPKLVELKARQAYWFGRCHLSYQKAHQQKLQLRQTLLQLFEHKQRLSARK
ncbi:hypothetical protein [Dongshaea marina]|uniref:hypothetical protein n=1 Tax=Dongshaea marina TaxID=2047966 RepID=UPI000D3ED85B|nr:hypothetical protein [Dongshaea marina]